jgi:anti-anti-sigma regulatory factor
MAINFQIYQRKTKDSVHLTLNGDFDGTSAHELINKLKTYDTAVHQVFINTNGLTSVHPFGQVVLYRNLPAMRHRSRSLVFLGDHRGRFSKP